MVVNNSCTTYTLKATHIVKAFNKINTPYVRYLIYVTQVSINT